MKKTIVILLIILLIFIIYMQINKSAEKADLLIGTSSKIFFAMGTVVEIIYESKDSAKINLVVSEIDNISKKIKSDEDTLSTAEKGIPVMLSVDFINLYKNAEYMHEVSAGRYDPTAITVSSLYGFPDKPWKIPEEEELKRAKSQAGLDNIVFNNKYFIKKTDAAVDLSASSKGYIVDKCVKYMKKHGMKNFIVNAGGDLYVDGLKYGKSKYRIYIEEPGDKQSYLSLIKLTNKAVATSGNYERYFIDSSGRRITHIFSGRDFEPVNNYQSVSVIADNAELADSYSTLYFLSELGEIKKYCEQFKTPVLVYTLENNLIRLCGWTEYEFYN